MWQRKSFASCFLNSAYISRRFSDKGEDDQLDDRSEKVSRESGNSSGKREKSAGNDGSVISDEEFLRCVIHRNLIIFTKPF